MRNPTPNTYSFHLLYWPTDVTPTSNNYSSEAPLIRSQMAHISVGTHYAIPVNTIPSDAISGPKNIFRVQQHITCPSVCVVYSITCTKCIILYIGKTCRLLSARFGEHLRSVEEKKHIRMMTTSTLQSILTCPNTQSITSKSLLFYTHQPKNCLDKPLEKKIIF